MVSNAAGASAEAREGLAAAAENGKDKSPSQPFASVEELLVSVGFLSLLPNFLEQEFDVGAIALMTDKDFEEISVRNRIGSGSDPVNAQRDWVDHKGLRKFYTICTREEIGRAIGATWLAWYIILDSLASLFFLMRCA